MGHSQLSRAVKSEETESVESRENCRTPAFYKTKMLDVPHTTHFIYHPTAYVPNFHAHGFLKPQTKHLHHIYLHMKI